MSLDVKRFVKAFDNAAQQAIGQKSLQLGKGQCKDMEEYKLRVGEIRGLEASIGLARDMLRQMELAEDEGFDQQKEGVG